MTTCLPVNAHRFLPGQPVKSARAWARLRVSYRFLSGQGTSRFFLFRRFSMNVRVVLRYLLLAVNGPLLERP